MMEAQANWTADVLAGRLILPNSTDEEGNRPKKGLTRLGGFGNFH
jgi:hypothetical protein